MISSLCVGALALVGVRLIVQAVRLREVAEGLLGLCIALASSGLVVAIEGVNGYVAGDLARFDLTRWGMLAVAVAVCSYTEFVRRAFRPDASWAKVLSIVLCVATLAGWYQVMYKLSYGYVTEPHPVGFTPRLVVFTWGIVESYNAYRIHKRRLAIGLADPVVVNRFLLFVIWNLLMIAVPASNALLRGADPDAVSALYRTFPWTIGSGLALVTVLIFFPPSAYLDMLRTGHEDAMEERV